MSFRMKNFKFVKKNIRRTPYQAIAAFMVMLLTFFVMSIFIIIAVGSEQILKFYEGKPQAIAFFKDGATDDDVQAIQQALSGTGKITNFHYVSKEEALHLYRERNKNNPTLLELVTANILPASLEISAKTPADLKPIAEIVKKEPVVEEVVFPEDVVASLTQATNLIRWVGGAIVGFLIIFATLIIVLIIGFKIRIKRDEIATMKLLGASSWFIRIPYLFEGMTYSLAGAVTGWLGSIAVIWYFQPLLKFNLGEVSNQLWPISPLSILGLLVINIALALVVGSIGSLTAVRRYLQI